ncbi:MAG TPA: right-handed parallel beta-helix repeat-containing protein [Acidimicrobiales bacterium]|nr:right-handed parallel beta-helix repeat-containing protein [Acidimicrobiales bacterium]
MRARVGIAALALAIAAGACSSDDDGEATATDTAATETTSAPATTDTTADAPPDDDRPATDLDAIWVPHDHPTIQAAVDAAQPGDLVLVDRGVYNEAVDVITPDITIRGVDRNEVIIDGEFELENGIRVLDTDGVVIENMTARNYTTNGFFWTGSDRYRGSYLTAYRNGLYGIYAFDSVTGQLDNSYASGSPDGGFYIGQCFECDAVIDGVVSEYNGLGYSGTNSGGDLYIVNSTFRFNRVGMVPNSGSYELCYPGRSTTIVGNTVHDNNTLDGPGIDAARLAQGNGILLAGSINNVVERNLVFNHDRAGIGAVPFPENDATDVPPPADQLDLPCDEVRDNPLPDPETVPELVLWNATGNRIVGNVVSDSGLADLASGTIDLGDGITNATLDNCFSGNTFATTAPFELEALAPCDGEGSGGDFEAGAFDLLVLIGEMPPEPAPDVYRTTPEPGPQETMPDALTRAAERFDGPTRPDRDAITVPARPAG